MDVGFVRGAVYLGESASATEASRVRGGRSEVGAQADAWADRALGTMFPSRSTRWDLLCWSSAPLRQT